MNLTRLIEIIKDAPTLAIVAGQGEADLRTITEVGTATGWDRREVYVDARDCETTDTLTVTTAHATYPWIDRVVVRLNASPGRTIDIVVKPGTAAPTPAAPALTRTAETWELSLAQVRVEVGATLILSAKITDERGDASLCGVACPAYVPSSQLEVVGPADMQGKALTGLPVPNAATDAARKGYVDAEIGGAISGFGISDINIDGPKNWQGQDIVNIGALQNQTGNIGARTGFVDVPGDVVRKTFSPNVTLNVNDPPATLATFTVPANYSANHDSNFRISVWRTTNYYTFSTSITVYRNGVQIGSLDMGYDQSAGNIDTTGGCGAGDVITVEGKYNGNDGAIVVQTVEVKSARRADIPTYKEFAETGAW